jgi:Pvc16 N-terminal domain
LPAAGLSSSLRAPTLSRAMIHDVDESLRALVKRDALNGSGVDVAFDAPTRDWVSRRNAPVVDMYLYDIREDTNRRQTAWEDVHDESGRVTGRRLPPRRYRLSYLVTAWTSRPEDEHRLLSSMLACFVQHEYMPPEMLVGTLVDQALPVLITVALPPIEDRSIADVWSAMGGELKPSLDLVITAPLDIARTLEAGPPVLEEPRLHLVADREPAEAAGGKRGRARGGSDGGMKRMPAATSSDGAADGVADETLIVGAPEQPGRHIRVRSLPRP